MAFNIAKYEGINSVPAAIVFAILYVPLAAWYIRVFLLHLRRYVAVLVLYCHIRIASFIIRAVLAGIESAGENVSIYIAEQVLLSIGYVGLLLAAYTLVMDRTDIMNQDYFEGSGQKPENPLGRLLSVARNRHLYRIAAMVAVIISIVGSTNSNGNGNTSNTLRKVSVIIFLVLNVLQVLNTLHLMKLEYADVDIRYPLHSSFGARNGPIILLAISLLLLLREVFVTATLGNTAVYQNEHFWYPLVAVPELMAAALYLVPGLIPESQRQQSTK